ncbi:MAG: secondary thiamine-phosphate synthase enzyme YjbQ [Candidatus Omnitrophica bacterium]|nr:secondary thiamine-phosphate synthase enzyme YjbQ [Candidatus Omnitrophota bacterium]MDD5351662.1 secondary thiamine-phosphate synthase enzyme YjbQ [Candidatus Omnitrophota bacterium]MDD5550872.1 secondary thiamine-phosphate synthase enzyme YjbQ [Candidatus Omnitrophota bacterium]
MKTITKFIDVSTKGNNDIIDITYEVKEKLRESKLEEGSVLLFITGSTAALTTMEYEPGQIQDLKEVVDKLIPHNKTYAHNHSMSGSDGNAHSHLRASLFKADLTIPFVDSELLLGTWQQIVLIDFDIYPRQRKIAVQFTGE